MTRYNSTKAIRFIIYKYLIHINPTNNDLDNSIKFENPIKNV